MSIYVISNDKLFRRRFNSRCCNVGFDTVRLGKTANVADHREHMLKAEGVVYDLNHGTITAETLLTFLIMRGWTNPFYIKRDVNEPLPRNIVLEAYMANCSWIRDSNHNRLCVQLNEFLESIG